MINRFVIVFLCFVANPGCARADEPQISAQAIFADDAAEELASAACSGDFNRVQNLVAGGTDVNSVGRFGVTPLIWALTCRGLQFNDMLANEVAEAGFRPTIEAYDSGYLSSLSVLLKAGANPNVLINGDYGPIYPGGDGFWIDRYSPVLIAAEFHQPEVLALLLENGGETTALILGYERGAWLDLSPQMSPFDQRQWRNMYLLLEAGAQPDHSVGNRYDVVEMASMNRPKIAEEILKRYQYTGDYEVIVYHLLERTRAGFPGEEDRRSLLNFLKVEKNVDIESIRSIYWKD
jgi:hypothetical protein